MMKYLHLLLASILLIVSLASAEVGFGGAGLPANWGGVRWGLITGTLSDQTDLQTELDTLDTAIGTKVGAFTWSTSEQVWPFEKAVGGGTIYAKAFAVASYPNATSANVAHGITGLDAMIKIWATASNGTVRVISDGNSASTFVVSINGSNIVLTTTGNSSSYSGHVYLLYTKS